MHVRALREDEIPAVAILRDTLWPDSVETHARELRELLQRSDYLVLIAEDTNIIAFAEVAVRLHKIGYLEGWFVCEEHRRRGIGAALVRAGEEWARSQGCVEMHSDTWIDNVVSQRAHEALGFEEVERVVNYRKAL